MKRKEAEMKEKGEEKVMIRRKSENHSIRTTTIGTEAKLQRFVSTDIIIIITLIISSSNEVYFTSG